MKSSIKKLAFASVLLLAFSSSFASAQEMTMACKGPKLTEKQVKALITSAKSMEDHHKLACYFQSEARSEEERAKYHEEMADLYAHSSNAKRDMIAHCKQFAEEARKAAENDRQLAAEHEQMAHEAK